ncbi:MAG: FliM/FliN family flagellar motor switch protein [Peptostreptococcaceae bacterium]|nr:FliM/FliN family flagellar motor switch protein [Peptostreptococcaceae bacterium]
MASERKIGFLDETVELSIEIGSTKSTIEEILEFGDGTLVVLDKYAGDTVDIFANDRLIARGDIIVVDDNLGIKIRELI